MIRDTEKVVEKPLESIGNTWREIGKTGNGVAVVTTHLSNGVT
ncbi:hypothetical protein [Microcoleus sp. BROC3]